jgi:hypothetical protein
LALASGLPAATVELPAGTEIQARLAAKLASNHSKANDPIEALLIAPVMAGGRIILPAGTKLEGQVRQVKAASPTGDGALLDLNFTNLVRGKLKIPLSAQVAAVDNARESVDANGQILGIVASQTLSSRIDQGIAKIQERYSGLAEVLQAAKGAIVNETAGDIVYEPGVEMTLKLTALIAVPEDAVADAGPKFDPLPAESELIALVNAQLFRTVAAKPPVPSDITNLMFIGSEEQLTATFQEAGWSTAAALSTQTKLETARAIIEARGYKEAPVSILLLDGKPPDLVFQKQNDTFAQRHHLRIWKRPATFQEKPVWVCAATHDIGIEFSEENRTFIHKIDPRIDGERSKVVNDLLFTGKVKSLALVGRPDVPRHSRNATGDDIETDAAMAVLVF